MFYTARRILHALALAVVGALALGSCAATPSFDTARTTAETPNDAPTSDSAAAREVSALTAPAAVSAAAPAGASDPSSEAIDALRATFAHLEAGDRLAETVCIASPNPDSPYTAAFETGPELVCIGAPGQLTYVLAFSDTIDADMADLLFDIDAERNVDLGAGPGVLGRHCFVDGLLPPCGATWRRGNFIAAVWGDDRSTVPQTDYLRANLGVMLDAAATASPS